MTGKPVFAVIGAGAIGGYMGAKLAQHGENVTLIDPWPEHVEAIRRDGLRIEGMTGAEDCVVDVEAMHLTEVQGFSKRRPIDVAFVATKSYDTLWATTMLRPYLAPNGFVVSLQNCINEEAVASVVGWGRTVGCVVLISAELVAPGHVLRTMGKQSKPYVEFKFGEVHGRITPRITGLAEAVQHFDGADVTGNLWGERWSKLCINAIRNGISAATGLSGNERDSAAPLRRFAIRVGGETVRTGQALGYKFDRVGSIAAETIARAAEGDPAAAKEAEDWMISGTLGSYRSTAQRPSMAQDILKGRRTEIDDINGFVVAKAATVGIATPASAALVDVVKAVERGDLMAHPENIIGLEERLAAGLSR
jgi:2-dehydropantoate 2-reductase